MPSKLKAIVCGTTFGKLYIQAINNLLSDYQLAGIICKGSSSSRELASLYNVPIYKSVDELPDDIDLACVIIRSEGVGGDGTKICLELLDKKISVLQEQPVFTAHLEKCYKLALKNKVIYLTANIYSNLENTKNFIDYARKLNRLSKLEYISFGCSTQLSYIALDLLSMCGISGSINFDSILKKELGPFDILTGNYGEVPFLLEFGNTINPKAPDYNMHTMYKFNLYYEDGLLSLNDAYGEVTWRPRSYIKPEETNKYVNKEYAYSLLSENYCFQVGDLYEKLWVDSIEKELLLAKEYIQTGKLNEARVNRELGTSVRWELLQKEAGFAKFLKENKVELLTLEDIKSEGRKA